MLSTDSNDAFMINVRDVEGDGRRHFLFHQFQAVFRAIVSVAADIDEKVVLVEDLKVDMSVALTHDLVDLSILLPAHKLLCSFASSILTLIFEFAFLLNPKVLIIHSAALTESSEPQIRNVGLSKLISDQS